MVESEDETLTVPTTPSSSTLMSAPVSAWMALMTLPLWSDDLADLVDRDLEADDLRRTFTHIVAGSGDSAVHDLEDLETSILGLVEGRSEHVGRNSVDLGVELERRDELCRSGNLEVHVAEGVLGSEDVGEGDVLALGKDEAHGDTGDRRLDRHTGIHQREAGTTYRGHRG